MENRKIKHNFSKKSLTKLKQFKLQNTKDETPLSCLRNRQKWSFETLNYLAAVHLRLFSFRSGCQQCKAAFSFLSFYADYEILQLLFLQLFCLEHSPHSKVTNSPIHLSFMSHVCNASENLFLTPKVGIGSLLEFPFCVLIKKHAKNSSLNVSPTRQNKNSMKVNPRLSLIEGEL
jgi:hypothetical protein